VYKTPETRRIIAGDMLQSINTKQLVAEKMTVYWHIPCTYQSIQWFLENGTHV